VTDGAFEAGLAVQRALWGDLVSSDGRPDTPAARVAPEFFPYVTEHVFGKIWARDTLGLRERELLTVAVLTTLGRMGELRGHLHASRNVGLTAEELVEAIIHVGVYAGLPAAVAALDVAAAVLEPADD
jgi:4-carboxymuconolactone decarboxylase